MNLTDLPLFNIAPRARAKDPDTAQTAGAKFRNRKVYADVLEALRRHGPLTDHQLAEKLGGLQTSIGKRRGELRDNGYVVDSGERRPSPSGSSAIVWKLRGE